MRVAREVLGKSVEFGGESHRGWLPDGASEPPPTPTRIATLDIRILDDDDGFILEWTSRNTDDSGDLRYGSLAEAVAEARELFGIAEAEWREVNVAS